MKFSYRLLKKVYPSVSTPRQTAQLLTMHLFEAEAVKGGLEVQVLPNRYSDAASHWGLAREIAAIMGRRFAPPGFKARAVKSRGALKVEIKSPHCRRMAVYQFDNIKIKQSPAWLRGILRDVGLRPINNLVDITNYVALETGQPLHAFDLDKMSGGSQGAVLIVRLAEKGEEVVSLDGEKLQLDGRDTALADSGGALDIAGIKGGKRAEIDEGTKRILLTAGNFDGAAIYRTSRRIGLITDASLRFAHRLSPELAAVGINRAARLVKELCGGRLLAAADRYLWKPGLSVHKFDIERFNKISGLNLSEKEALAYLLRLGFKLRPGRLAEAPFLRTDIERFEDLAEEILRLYGYQNLPAVPPRAAIKPTADDEAILFQRKVKDILAGFGLDEVYNYSFVSEELSEADAVPLKNPPSRRFARLRSSLLTLLLRNIEDNRRFFKRVAIFEIGKAFQPREKLRLGIALYDKGEKAVLEVKGLVDSLLERLGLVDYFFKEDQPEQLKVESDGHLVGLIKNYSREKAAAEIDLEKLMTLVKEEKSYEPLSRYPSIDRDLSFAVPKEVRFSEIMSLIESAALRWLDDVDLIDFYEDSRIGADRRSLTLRLVFQAKDRTLTDAEADGELKKISRALVKELNAEIR